MSATLISTQSYAPVEIRKVDIIEQSIEKIKDMNNESERLNCSDFVVDTLSSNCRAKKDPIKNIGDSKVQVIESGELCVEYASVMANQETRPVESIQHPEWIRQMDVSINLLIDSYAPLNKAYFRKQNRAIRALLEQARAQTKARDGLSAEAKALLSKPTHQNASCRKGNKPTHKLSEESIEDAIVVMDEGEKRNSLIELFEFTFDIDWVEYDNEEFT